ncbi:MAG: hypothetical protein EPO12_18270 [Aquabacterium sp.]|nr:MAG: hypothetical protein EPO12_18270 [Aquabacterium sp.]
MLAEDLLHTLRTEDEELQADAALDHIDRARREWARKRPASLTARQALECMRFEVLVVRICAVDMEQGVGLNGDDMARLRLAIDRIETIAREVLDDRG